MKQLVFIVMACLTLSSCAPSIYYQMYQTQPVSGITMHDDCMVFEDDNCEILYNFWKENGEIGFVFFNKTTENIYLHLDECFYVENGFAYDYYRNRVYTNSRSYLTSTQLTNINSSYFTKSKASANANYYYTGAYGTGNAYGGQIIYKNGYVSGATNTIANASSNSVSIAEKTIICIPPKTSKIITEFDIKNSVYRSCDIYRNPGKKDPHSVTFSKENTPLTFGNIIAYSIGKREDLIRINNEFYVSKISNYNSSDITKLESVEECGKKKDKKVRVFNESGPNQFYIQYSIMNDGKKH